LDYDVLENSTKATSKENKILVAVVSKDVVSQRIQEANEAGLNVIAVEPSPLALFAGLCYFSPPGEDNITLLLDIGYDMSAISIAVGQDVYFVQDITTSGNFLTEAIRDYFQVDYKDAEELKCQYGLEKWSSVPDVLTKGTRAIERQDINSLSPALASGLENLIIDIEHSYKYLSNQLLRLGASGLSRIIICGGGGKLKGLDAFLRNRFNVPVEIFNPLSSLIIGDEVIGKINLRESGTTFGIAVGLALRGAEERESR
jgi:type IV pilus assembly protein PilM